MNDIILIGGGGHCKSVIDSLEKNKAYRIIGIIDIEENIGKKIYSYEVIGTDDDLQALYSKGVKHTFITLGSIGNSYVRERIYNKAKKIGFVFPNIKDQSAVISDYAFIDEGVFVGKGVIINASAKVGKNCIINSGSVLDHDVKVGQYSHIAPSTTISGSTIVKEHTHIGTNSTIIQGITIGSNVLIGAGSVVVNNIKDNVKAFGNPCKER